MPFLSPFRAPLIARKSACLHLSLALLGSLLLGLSPTATLASSGPIESVIYRFTGGADGGAPEGPLLIDKAGNLYGATGDGGKASFCPFIGCGVVFELSPLPAGGWRQKVLYSFTGGADGSGPNGQLVMDSAGNLYGSTYGGGIQGFGTIFELSPNDNGSWQFTTLYEFAGEDDGQNPAPLAIDAQGNLYGTTSGAGVFELKHGASGWTKSVVYAFTGGSDGYSPLNGVVLDKSGNLYGTTYGGGGSGCYSSTCGTIYKLTPSGEAWHESTIYAFNVETGSPGAGLAVDAGGNLYGTTIGTGDCSFPANIGDPGCGSIFELTSAGTFSLIHTFTGGTDGNADGGAPSTLALYNGGIYGVTGNGGNYGCYSRGGCGTAFALHNIGGSWSETILHRFQESDDDYYPSSIAVDANGTLYGTTIGGYTANNAGTIFVIVNSAEIPSTVPAPAFSPASGVYTSGQTVTITDAMPGAGIYYTTDGSTPTAASKAYTGPLSVTGTERITAAAIVASLPPAIASAVYTIASGTAASVLNLGLGFPNAGGMQFNGQPTAPGLDGSRLQLTDGRVNSQASSAFFATPVNIQSFTTYFTFQVTAPYADGFTFAIQNTGTTALGNPGRSLGYTPIGKSVAIKFDLHDNAGEGPNSTGLYVDGALPTVSAINLTGTGIDLHSEDTFLAQITYDGTSLVLNLTDTLTLATWSHSFAIDIPATVGAKTAFVGFTAGTGDATANQEILSWTYVSGAPGSPAPPYSAPSLPGYPSGFAAVGVATNGSAALAGTSLQLTDGGSDEAGSAFYRVPVAVDQSFTTDFTFQLSSSSGSVPLSEIADGFTFTILNADPNVSAGLAALGGFGSSLGFHGIDSNSGFTNYDMAVKFDLYDNHGEGPDSTGLYVNGASPTIPAFDLGSGIDLHSGHRLAAHIVYEYAATTLTLTLTDTVTAATWSHAFTIDISKTIGSNSGYVGFTAGTGGGVAVQDILNWTLTTP